MKISKTIAFIFTAAILTAVQFTHIHAQSSTEIERLTTAISKSPENDLLYVERGMLYTWREKFIGPDVPFAVIGKTIDDNRANAKADAEKAMKINQFNYNAYVLRGIVFRSLRRSADSERDFQQAAKLRSESKIVASIYKLDVSGGKAIYPPYTETVPVLNVIVRGDQKGLLDGFDTSSTAKEFAKRHKMGQVIMFDTDSKKYFLYEAFITENIYPNIQLAETPFSKSIKGKSKMPLTYEFLKIEPEYSVQPVPKDVELDHYPVKWKVADIIDAEGLTLFKNPRVPLLRGSKGVRLLFDSELGASNFDEALKIYQWLEKVNINGNDLDVVKTMRRTNLGKLYRAADKLRPFVEKEMSRWKYTEEEKIAIRGTKI
jgi:tetratricopeptide (TPR) repeat protein